jgi:hypothetical protein
MQFALNLLLSTLGTTDQTYGPHPKNYYDGDPIKIEIPSFPLSIHQHGSYKEPKDGVRIKMLSLNSKNKLQAVKLFRAKTGITILGSRDVIVGKCFCPRLEPALADQILKEFQDLNIHAKISDFFRSAGP